MKRRGESRGLTLIELLIAVAITAIIGTLVYGSFDRTYQSREFVLRAQERYHTARLALERMSREVASAFVYDCRKLDSPTGEQRQQTLFKVEPEGKVSRMTFTSFSHLRLFRDVRESDQNVVSYYGKPDRRQGRQLNLMRREKTRIDERPEEGGREQVLCPDVLSLQIELWDENKQDWVESWDCSQVERLNTLPRMVRFTLTVLDEYGKELPLRTIARLHLQKPLANFIKRSL
jgi:general secretion pathway protein J